MKLTPNLLFRPSLLKMALHPPPNNAKLIFAPANDKTNAQADQFVKGALDRKDLDSNPLTQFHSWFSHAQKNGVYHPETVCLSTASLPSGRVSARMVYLKELDAKGGFVIYSNWGTSRKAKDIAENKWASLTFWWQELERQVRVEGKVERLPDEESQVYYDLRARGSRIGAWASPQSQVLKGREELEERVKEVEKRFEGQEKIPVPEFWGGLRIVPEMVEFWQGRDSRLHDRFQYEKKEDGEWDIQRLSP
ncbi:putative pyridoxamine 5 -phosphate oxidase protein [Botrytis fragariae]|uniref:pyridoxal 5'-phosphate synthase n=1 Tax=Botrytis fragariae TaxID=1964551 RepID=A0A8H6ASK9_9HELO|nr:putative pyridoxamine 5 -phosphate oxidase protein [Botrytis fragariae]KAF5872803.1 putative pyridoxamine 5 -phosphate oxidase protein [Botrytis fragariae]